jgi:hypothetical protein
VLDIIIVLLPTDAQLNCLKNNFRIYIKIGIKTTPTCFGVARSNSALPDDGDYTEKCWSFFIKLFLRQLIVRQLVIKF